jgi:diadenosine tetraphosphate (Ap4A) HIT family hydrolase
MKSGIRCEGVNLILAHKPAAGQEVFHAHLHVIPRFRGDNLKIRFGLLKKKPARADLDGMAAQIREKI